MIRLGNIYLDHNILLLISVGVFIFSIIVQMLLTSKMKKYAQQDVSSGKSGAEVASQMLDDNDISVIATQSLKAYCLIVVEETPPSTPSIISVLIITSSIFKYSFIFFGKAKSENTCSI